MRLKFLLSIVFFISLHSFAQQGINYKAIIKDGSGNVVANQGITVQFIIYKGAALTDNVYQEKHTPITNDNGLIFVNIGEGTEDSGDYTAINWASDDHFLNVQINTGSGLVDLGTTQFMAVPYALSAGNTNWTTTGDNLQNDNTGNVKINSNSTNPLTIQSSGADNFISFNNSGNNYKGYLGIYTGDNDLDFGTGSGNITGKVHLVTQAQPRLTVIENGNIGINTTDPVAKLQIKNGADAALNNGTGYVVLGTPTGTNIALDSNEIMARYNGATSPLYLQLDGGNVVLGEGELQKTSTGNANLLPIAYGYVDSNGSIIGGTGNFAVTRVETGFGPYYDIRFFETLITNNTVVFLQNKSSGISGSRYDFASDGSGNTIIVVDFTDETGLMPSKFSFIVYQL